MDAMMLVTNPTTAIIQAITEKFTNVSFTVIPLILPMTQKPLSAIQAIGLEPHPTASAR